MALTTTAHYFGFGEHIQPSYFEICFIQSQILMAVRNTNRFIGGACLHDAKQSKDGCTQSGDSQLLIIICLASHHLLDICICREIIPFFQERVATASASEA